MRSAAAAIAVAILSCAAPVSVASAHTPEPQQARSEKAKPTARLRSLRYDARGKAYVVRATIALAMLSRPAAVRAKTELVAKLTYTKGKRPRTAKAASKLTAIKVVSKDVDEGLAVVELRVASPRFADKASIRTSVDLVGANPTPHP